jgi:VCBS repeat-containing protein
VPGAALAANGPPHPVTDTVITNEDTPAAGNVLANDTNGGQGPLIVTSFTALSPAIGTLTIDADGNYVFTPAANWNGSTSTTYNVANNKHTRPGTINITVLPVNDAPTANDDTVTATEDASDRVTAGLLANDTDPDGDTLAVTAVANATGGTVGLVAGVVTLHPGRRRVRRGRRLVRLHGRRRPQRLDPAHATVSVTCVDDAPVATDDGASGPEDADVVIVAADLAADDTDPEGDALTVTGVNGAIGGTVAWSRAPSRSAPPPTSAAPAAAGFDYTVDDGNGSTDTGHVTVDITCVDDAPVANDDTVTVSRTRRPTTSRPRSSPTTRTPRATA